MASPPSCFCDALRKWSSHVSRVHQTEQRMEGRFAIDHSKLTLLKVSPVQTDTSHAPFPLHHKDTNL